MKRILYVHHGGTVGGAPLSLLYLLQQLHADFVAGRGAYMRVWALVILELWQRENLD